MLSTLKDGGTFLLNCQWSDEELDANLPASMKQQLAKKHIKFYAIDQAEFDSIAALEASSGYTVHTYPRKEAEQA